MAGALTMTAATPAAAQSEAPTATVASVGVAKKRLHVRPNGLEVQACKPWLLAELSQIQPDVLVCLGATAAQAFLGRGFTLARNRGRIFDTPWARQFMVSYHPSAVLRAGEEAQRQATYAALVEDLRRAAQLLRSVA